MPERFKAEIRMKLIDYILIGIIVAVVALAVFLMVRRRKTGCCSAGSGCCGDCSKCSGCSSCNSSGYSNCSCEGKGSKHKT